MAGTWGGPSQTIERALLELAARGIAGLRASPIVATPPMGPMPQAVYANAAAIGATRLSPYDVLVLAKFLEADAGRLGGPRWGPRPLDIDILDYEGVIMGWEHPHDPMRPAQLVLPHPEMHKRRFVLEPLQVVAPDWRHPVLGLSIDDMLAKLPETA